MKKNLVKVVGVVLAMTMVLSACGCKKNEKESEDQKAVSEEIEECLDAESALALVDEFMTDLEAGDIAAAKALALNEINGSCGLTDENALSTLYSNFFSNSTYTVEVLDEGEDSVTLSIVLDAPKINETFDLAAEDPSLMAPLLAEVILSVINGDTSVGVSQMGTVEGLVLFFGQVSRTTMDISCSVVADESKPNGMALDISLEALDSAFEQCGFTAEQTSAMSKFAMDSLLDNGSITQEEYDANLYNFTGLTGSENVEPFTYEEGDDFWSCDLIDADGIKIDEVSEGASEFEIKVVTYSYPGEPLPYKAYLNDELLVEDVTDVDEDAGDTFYVNIESSNGAALSAGVYKIEVYSVDGSTLIVTAYINVPEVA